MFAVIRNEAIQTYVQKTPKGDKQTDSVCVCVIYKIDRECVCVCLYMRDKVPDSSPSSPPPPPPPRRGITVFKVTDTQGNTVVKSVEQELSRAPSSSSSSSYRPREKVAVERGFSMRDWHQRISATRRVSSGGGGGARLIPMSEVRRHRSVESAWTVLRGKVYDMTPFLRYHPGGVEKLMMGAGRDMTSLFDKYHSWVNIDFLIGSCYLGELAPEEANEPSKESGNVP